MKDRRVRLRPKNGARNLYYSAVSPLGNNLFNQALPWISSNPIGQIAANAPNIISGVTSGIENVGSSIVNTVSNAISNPIGTISNLFSSTVGSVGQSFSSGGGTSAVGGSINILEPLSQTDGLVFPFTPDINLSQSVDYASNDIVHSNQEFLSYTRTKAPQITVSGQFVVQNSFEASYALACIHFLRTVVKMSFGQQSQNPGTPPPVLILSAYGEYMFNEVPVIVQAYTVDFSKDVDYIQVPNTDTVVPSMFTLTVTLTVQNTPTKQRSFNLQQFRSGQLLKGGSWI